MIRQQSVINSPCLSAFSWSFSRLPYLSRSVYPSLRSRAGQVIKYLRALMNRMLSQASLSFCITAVCQRLPLFALSNWICTNTIPFQTGVCEAAVCHAEAVQLELFSKLENVKSHFNRRPLTENRRRVKRFHSGGYILSFPVSSSGFIYSWLWYILQKH